MLFLPPQLRTTQPTYNAPLMGPGFGWVPTGGRSAGYGVGNGGALANPASPTSVGLAPFTRNKNFSIVAIFCAPLANQGLTPILRIGSAGSDGVRCEVTTTAGAINQIAWTENGVANFTGDVISTSAFTTQPVCSIVSFGSADGNTWVSVMGNKSSYTDRAIYSHANIGAMNAPADFNVQLNGGSVNWYGVAVLPYRIGDSMARSLVINPWQLWQVPTRSMRVGMQLSVTNIVPRIMFNRQQAA